MNTTIPSIVPDETSAPNPIEIREVGRTTYDMIYDITMSGPCGVYTTQFTVPLPQGKPSESVGRQGEDLAPQGGPFLYPELDA